MLVLSRRIGEQIVIGSDIRVTLVAINRDRARLGVSAPPAVCVDRQEIHERRESEGWSETSATPRAGPPVDPAEETASKELSSPAANRQREQIPVLIDFTQAIGRAPDDSSAYFDRGQAYQMGGDDEHAILDYTEALRLDPQHSRAYRNRGTAYYNQGRDILAIADYTETIRLDPQNAWTYHQRGMAYAKRGDYPQAIADYTEAIRLDPNRPHSYLDRACARHDQDARVESIAGLSEAIRSHPEDAWAFGRLAWLWATAPEAELRDGKLAVAYAWRACKLSAWHDAGHLSSLAAAYAETGRYDQAVHWAEKALARASEQQEPASRARLGIYQTGKPYREPER